MIGPGRVGPVARTMGFAGLLPQAIVVGVLAAGRLGAGDALLDVSGVAIAVGAIYPLAILNFLGGMWWGLAMRLAHGQSRWIITSISPTIMALALAALLVASSQFAWMLVAIGCAVVLTLLADRQLANERIAPEGWMELRTPLSLGLGGLTILAGALVGTPTTVY